MKPVKTSTTNIVLTAPKGQEDDIFDLPVTNYKIKTPEGEMDCVMSCWELSKEELEQIQKTGKIYFHMYGVTHPPMLLTTTPLEEMLSNE